MVAPVRSFTVDTSAWINGFISSEPGHAISRAFLDRLVLAPVPIVVPTLLRVEVAGAIAFAEAVASLPFVRLSPSRPTWPSVPPRWRHDNRCVVPTRCTRRSPPITAASWSRSTRNTSNASPRSCRPSRRRRR